MSDYLWDSTLGWMLGGPLHTYVGSSALPQMDAEGRLLYAPWRPIETAPKDGGGVLLYEGFEPVVCQGWFDKDGEEWRPTKGSFFRAPTHWMPLPEPPK